MLTQQKLMLSLALVLFTVPASADSLVYVVNGNNQFGTIDLATGAFRQIGPNGPGNGGLAPGPNGSLLTLTFSGNLDSINPATGVTSRYRPHRVGRLFDANLSLRADLGQHPWHTGRNDLCNRFPQRSV